MQEIGIGVENPPQPLHPGMFHPAGSGKEEAKGGEGGKAEQTERGGIKRIKVAAGGGGEGAGETDNIQNICKSVSSPAVLPGNQEDLHPLWKREEQGALGNQQQQQQKNECNV